MKDKIFELGSSTKDHTAVKQNQPQEKKPPSNEENTECDRKSDRQFYHKWLGTINSQLASRWAARQIWLLISNLHK